VIPSFTSGSTTRTTSPKCGRSEVRRTIRPGMTLTVTWRGLGRLPAQSALPSGPSPDRHDPARPAGVGNRALLSAAWPSGSGPGGDSRSLGSRSPLAGRGLGFRDSDYCRTDATREAYGRGAGYGEALVPGAGRVLVSGRSPFPSPTRAGPCRPFLPGSRAEACLGAAWLALRVQV